MSEYLKDSSFRRFLAFMYVMTAVLILSALKHEPSQQVLEWSGLLTGGFLGISAWGHVKRTQAQSKVPKPAPVVAAVKTES